METLEQQNLESLQEAKEEIKRKSDIYGESSLKIYTTDDYSLFKHYDFNRPVDMKHAKQLSIMMQTVIDLHPYMPIVVNSDMYIIDGQHRLEARKLIEAPVYYTIAPEVNIYIISKINRLNKKWTLSECIENYARNEVGDFKDFVLWCKENGWSYMIGLEIIGHGDANYRNKLMDQGQLSFQLNKDIHDLADLVSYMFYGDIKVTRQGIKSYIRALKLVTKQRRFNKRRWMTKYRQVNGKLIPQSTNAGTIKELERVYNFRLTGNEEFVSFL